MKRLLELRRPQHSIFVLAEPICGVDFCDTCGDCLYCYGNEQYSEDQDEHRWVRPAPAPSIRIQRVRRYPETRHRSSEL